LKFIIQSLWSLMMKTLLIASILLTAAAQPALAGDAAAGKAKAAVCAACHGAEGKAAIPTYPNLAGQQEQYIKLSLKAYKAGERSGGQAAIMAGMAAPLTDEDIDNLAAYYSSL
jgi:cytochrome c553